MISATILNILQNGTSVSVEYVLLDDQDPFYSKQGVLPVPIGWTTTDINNQLIPIVDAANYAESLKPLINSQMESPNLAPTPAEPIIQTVQTKEIL